MLNFSVEDPTFYDFKSNPNILKIVADGIDKHNDYADVQGSLASRKFLAKKYSTKKF